MWSTLLGKLRTRFSPAGQVEMARDRAFVSLYKGIRAGRLKSVEAMNVWARLEQFEEQREQMLDGRLSRSGIEELMVGYNYLVDYMSAMARSLIHTPAVRPRGISAQRFQWLYHGVGTGAVSCEELKLGAYLLRLEPHVLRESAVVRTLHAKLWGGAA